MEKILINTIVQQNEEIDDADLNGEKVMMNLDKGMYFALNEIGTNIWNMIKERKRVDEIVEVLLKEYEVNKEVCIESVISFLEGLKQNELIVTY